MMDRIIVTIAILTIFVVIGLLVFAGIMLGQHLANAVTNDPAANCYMHEFPYIQWCQEEKFDEFMDKYNKWAINRTVSVR